MTKKILVGLLLVGALTGCNDDDNSVNLETDNIFVCKNENGIPNANEYPVTHFSKIELSEVKTGDAQPVTTTQTYIYETGRLANLTLKQNFVAGESVEIKSGMQITYENHKAIVTDDYGYISTYTLNDKGYAISCIRQEGINTRFYTFSYLVNPEGKYFLKNVTESLDGNQTYSAIHIDYSDKRELHITEQTDNYEQSYTATTPTEEEIANTSELPFLFLAELYPLSFHTAALYGKLLGDPYNVLVTRFQPDENSESNETVTYNYTLNVKGIVTSCRNVTNSYGTNYVRTVNYTIE